MVYFAFEIKYFLSVFFSKEHYYDGESGTGYLAWRVKTIQRGLAKDRRASFEGTQ